MTLMAAAKQRTGLDKKTLHALADANDVEYTQNTTNADLEDALEGKGVNLESAEEAGDPTTVRGDRADDTPRNAPRSTGREGVQADGHEDEDMTLVKSPRTQSGTAPVTGSHAHASDAEPEASSGTPEALGADDVVDVDELEDVDTGKLMAVKDIIDRVLNSRGAATTAVAPTSLLETAKDVPVYNGEVKMTLAQAAATEGLTPPIEKGVKPFGFHVRQASDPHTNTAYGPAYVVVVDENGGKHAAEL